MRLRQLIEKEKDLSASDCPDTVALASVRLALARKITRLHDANAKAVKGKTGKRK